MSSFATDVIARALVLIATAWLAATLARRQAASLRAGIWTLAFASLLALPALARVTPAWRIPVLPAAQASDVMPLSNVGGPAGVGRLVVEAEDAGKRRDQSAVGTVSASAAASAGAPLRIEDRDRDHQAQVGLAAVNSGERRGPLTLQMFAWTLWAVVAFALLARVVLTRIAAARLIRDAAVECAVGDANWRRDIEAASAELGITRRVGIRFTDAVAVPAIIGVWRPVLLLPSDAGHWASDARRVVVLHELAHVARWDGLDQLVADVGCALYWIVPLVWIAARSAVSLREQATDDAVLRAGVKPSAYAANLIDLARNIAGIDVNAASLAMAASRIQDRVAAILDPSARRGRVTRHGAIALIVVAGLTVTTLAAVTPERQQVPPSPPLPPQAPMAPMAPPAPPAPFERMAPPAPVPPLPPPPAPPPLAPALSEPMPPLVPPTPPAPPAPLGEFAPLAPPAPPTPLALPLPAPFPPTPRPPFAQTPPTPPGATVMSHSSSGVAERSALCPDGRDSFSNSSNTDGSHHTWSVTISGRGCSVDLKSEGKVEFTDDFTDVRSITPSGYFRLSMRRADGRRELDIEGRGTSLTHTYRVDGSARPYDADAKAWFGEFLIELDRETAVGVDVRLPGLLKQGGVDAVLKETGLMTSDYARSRYYEKLSETVTITPADAVRILNQAVSLGTQDYYAAELLKSLGPRLGDSSSDRAALFALVGGMKSDYYIVEGVNSVFNTRRVNASDVDFLLRLTPKISSDYYKHEIVRRIVDAGRLEGVQRGQLSQVLTGMHEDYYMSAVVTELMRDGGADAAGRRAIIGALSRIRSGYYASETVRAVVRDPKLEEQDLLQLIDVVKPIHEDHYKSEALRLILRHANATSKVRQAAIDAAAGMSKYYRDEVLRFVRVP